MLFFLFFFYFLLPPLILLSSFLLFLCAFHYIHPFPLSLRFFLLQIQRTEQLYLLFFLFLFYFLYHLLYYLPLSFPSFPLSSTPSLSLLFRFSSYKIYALSPTHVIFPIFLLLSLSSVILPAYSPSSLSTLLYTCPFLPFSLPTSTFSATSRFGRLSLIQRRHYLSGASQLSDNTSTVITRY